jgi:hypothetical protein
MDLSLVLALHGPGHARAGQGKSRSRRTPLRFIHLYLVGYIFLIIGIGLALWQVGVLSRIAPIWIGIGAILAIGVGIMLSVSSGKPTMTEELERK